MKYKKQQVTQDMSKTPHTSIRNNSYIYYSHIHCTKMPLLSMIALFDSCYMFNDLGSVTPTVFNIPRAMRFCGKLLINAFKYKRL